jgi:hypothetical protein
VKYYGTRGTFFQYEEERGQSEMTALGGLPLYLDLFRAMGLKKSIDRHLRVRANTQGWRDSEVVSAVILLNLAGGDSVDDVRILQGDEGFSRVLGKVQAQGLSRKERQEVKRRWRKGRTGAVPSPSSIFRYLSAFHDREQEELRVSGKAFIPALNEHLRWLARINRDIVGFGQRHRAEATATLDIGVTLVEANKAKSLYCYKGCKSYQLLNVW